jgi:hypothetical protein
MPYAPTVEIHWHRAEPAPEEIFVRITKTDVKDVITFSILYDFGLYTL